MSRWLSPIFILLAFASCSSPRVEQESSPPLLDPSILGRPFKGPYPLFVALPDTVYYLTGPQQARPPDGSFEMGMRVALVLDAGSYSLVTSESGVTAYVSSGALRLIE